MAQLTAAQALLNLIDATRRAGSTTVLLESPKVASGEALFVAGNQSELDQVLQDCPNLRGTTLDRLKRGRERGKSPRPVVFDLSMVYAALLESTKGPRDLDHHPYEIVDSGESREVQQVLRGDGTVERLEVKPGSEKAWVEIRLRDGTLHKVEVPYTLPRP